MGQSWAILSLPNASNNDITHVPISLRDSLVGDAVANAWPRARPPKLRSPMLNRFDFEGVVLIGETGSDVFPIAATLNLVLILVNSMTDRTDYFLIFLMRVQKMAF